MSALDVEYLQNLTAKWPGVTTDVKWGNDLCFLVAGKMFCVAGLDSPLKIGFKVPDDEFEELSVREGFMPAPYMARAKWVLVTQPNKVSKKEWEQFIKQSYELVKSKLTKKQQAELK